MAESKVSYQAAYLRAIKTRVGTILENNYKIDINTRQKVLEDYLGDDQLPHWYFYSNSPEEIARHLFILTQLLASNVGQLHHVSDDSRVITYLINVGRDFPGRLERIIEENASMRIASFDSESTRNGIRIVSLEKIAEDSAVLSEEQQKAIEKLKSELLYYGDNRDISTADRFVESLSARYMLEEVQSTLLPKRSERHLVFYDRIMDSGRLVVDHSSLNYEDDIGSFEHAERVMIGAFRPNERFIISILRVFEQGGINIRRAYYDLFRHPDGDVCMMSVYFAPLPDLSTAVCGLEQELLSLDVLTVKPDAETEHLQSVRRTMDRRIEHILRRLGGGTEALVAQTALEELQELCRLNSSRGQGEESGSFYLNCVSDFLDAAARTGILEAPAALRRLLGYEAFDEFFVSARSNGVYSNVPGYRIKHSIARGPSKGGLRIDPIVSFDEVAALSFMMTWKCARSRILFGGAKGGLMLNPRTFEGSAIDFFDTLSSFGRSLFLVSGPCRDVPAGDVGCGGEEIAYLFEGFKSALRDLSMMAYGLKPGVSMLGARIVSIQDARRMLSDHFNVDWTDPLVLRELVGNEEYLELVCAAQITGKPKRGIAARSAATGVGMAYAVLAALGNLYLEGKWTASQVLSEEDTNLLKKACGINESRILQEESVQKYLESPDSSRVTGKLLESDEWQELETRIYPALLRGKRLVVQGSGKVGGALMKALQPYGVNLVAVGDAGGVIYGNELDPDEVLKAVADSRKHADKALRASCVHAKTNVSSCIYGMEAGQAMLEMECDILALAALENAVTEKNAYRIKTKLEVCGANGPNSSRAEQILAERGISVLYDFLANGAGVTASYFEWLRNLADRFRYEAEHIRGNNYVPDCMDPYVMPEFRTRIKNILNRNESPELTKAWNFLLRDIIFAAFNEDYRSAAASGISMKCAGFMNAQLRVLAAQLCAMNDAERRSVEAELPEKTRKLLEPFMMHPETELFKRKQDQ